MREVEMADGRFVVPGEIVPHSTDEYYRTEFKMTWLDEPRTLYRSVSERELYSIWSNGVIMGGGNGFNEFDTRPFVLFGDQITTLLLWQGEDRERTAIRRCLGMYAEESSAIQREGAALRMAEADWVSRYNARMPYPITQSQYAVPRTQDAEWRRLRSWSRDFDARFAEETRKFRWNVKQELYLIGRELEGKPFTSVVFETKPLSGCRVYDGSFSRAELEYGFLPGQVEWADLAAAHIVRDGMVLGSLELGGLEDLLSDPEGFDLRRMRPPGPEVPLERQSATVPAPTPVH